MAHLHSELRGTPVSQSVPRRSKSTVGFAIKKGKCEQQKSWEGSPRPGRRVARVKGVGRERLKKGSSNVVRGNRVTTYGSIVCSYTYVQESVCTKLRLGGGVCNGGGCGERKSVLTLNRFRRTSVAAHGSLYYSESPFRIARLCVRCHVWF